MKHIVFVHGSLIYGLSQWDPKITTPPGLYLLSTGILKPLQLLGPAYFACTPANLRLINLLFSCGNFYLAYCITNHLHPQRAAQSAVVLTALSVATFPPIYFFSTLYYTDPGALFFVLLMYMFHLHSRYTMAAIFGGLAILFRQTNIIWVLFIAASRSLAIMQANLKIEGSRRKLMPAQLVYALYNQRRHLPVVVAEVLGEMGVYLFLGLVFLAAALFNQGLALGDKEAHTLALNLPQLGYFLTFTLGFANSHLLTVALASRFTHFLAQNTALVGAVACLAALAINHLTLVHPYLLADNRHLTFYVWRKLIARNAVTPYLVIPLAIYAGWAILQRLSHKTALWRVVFLSCVALAIVPQRLLEFRYFVIPYVLLRLNFAIYTPSQFLLELLLHAVVNIGVLLIFALYPFTWPAEPEVIQRIIW
ncbi:ALG10 [Cordylochernes scorpioides]|uniref:Dol-P-Glc:Glc(2)Man(9)GlcNAc(2)-PP-Dol alpha-1,2-glucosyltransferase n=1 Tax=Cordylochernes scorpioides TaxID=51811 RepID=A0ABY6KW55_9ARAC|nr:ALG10 [Cordylochernes scorpioides]